MDAALPKYEEGMKAAQELKLGNNPWLDKIRERIREINPSSESLNIQITEWVPDKAPLQQPQMTPNPDGESTSGVGRAAQGGDEIFNRNMRRIQNILSMQISVEEKIKQLNRIEMEAQRNIVLEEEKIKELKEKM
jgi:hypothetical protein